MSEVEQQREIESDSSREAIRQPEETARETRRRLVRGYPHPRLNHVHLRGAQLLPSRLDLLEVLPKRGIVCELGVANGDFSAEILARAQPARLHLVDAWEATRYHCDQDTVRTRFSDGITDGSIHIHVGRSVEQLLAFPDHYFDWVYLDTVHDYRTTSRELALCHAKVKPDGIIAGHDHTPGNVVTPVCYGVIPAVQEFCIGNRWRYLYLTCESHGYASFALQAIHVREGDT